MNLSGLRICFCVLPLLCVMIALASCTDSVVRPAGQPDIPVGILHSLTGTMAFSEEGVVKATLLAMDEINQQGGVLGRRLRPIVRDGASEGAVFARKAAVLIQQDQVQVIFGCWTSDSRRSVLPIVERHDHLLFYPVQYEGMERSKHVVYLGTVPNQQILPAVQWAMENLGRRFYLVGSDYVFPRAAHAVIRDQLAAMRGEVLGEAFLPLGSDHVSAIVDEIVALAPDVILNNLNGDSNVAFFRELRARGITPQKIPTISFSIGEGELAHMGVEDFVGDYAVWHYFQSVPGAANRRFVESFQARHGPDSPVTAPMEAAYVGVHLWAIAAERAGSVAPARVRAELGGLSMAAPRGPATIDLSNQHLWMPVRIGRIRNQGQFAVVWSSPKPVRPIPYPHYRTEAEWDHFLAGLFEEWGGFWASPASRQDRSGGAEDG